MAGEVISSIGNLFLALGGFMFAGGLVAGLIFLIAWAILGFRSYSERAEQSLGNRTDGDWPSLPDDFKSLQHGKEYRS